MADNNLFQNLADRFARGESLKSLSVEAGIPWQKLHGLFKASGVLQIKPGQQAKPPKARPQVKVPPPSTGAVTKDADGIHRISFDSVGEAVIDALADYAQNDGNLALIRQRLASHLSGDDSWANYFTKSKLLDTIANPPQELLDSVTQMRDALMDDVCPPVTSRRRVVRNQDCGDELTPEAVLVRSLTPWERMSRETTPRRTVTIGVNLTVNASQRAKHLLWRGAAAAALADILTQRGVNVEIVAFWTIGDMSTCSTKVVSRYMVKRADMPLDAGAVAVALAEIAYARIVCLYGLARHLPGRLSKHLGHCETLPAQDRAGIDYLAETNITSQEAAESWLKEAAARQESEALHV